MTRRKRNHILVQVDVRSCLFDRFHPWWDGSVNQDKCSNWLRKVLIDGKGAYRLHMNNIKMWKLSSQVFLVSWTRSRFGPTYNPVDPVGLSTFLLSNVSHMKPKGLHNCSWRCRSPIPSMFSEVAPIRARCPRYFEAQLTLLIPTRNPHAILIVNVTPIFLMQLDGLWHDEVVQLLVVLPAAM